MRGCEPEPKKMTGLVSDIERGSTLDGPGMRTVVFLKGCPLSCVWCHNPETLLPFSQPVWDAGLCAACGRCAVACPAGTLMLGREGMHFTAEACRQCAMPCVRACPNAALSVCGERMEPEAVLDIVRRDVAFYVESGGGVTFSGGEPLAQAAFVTALARSCRESGIRTALDTSCFSSWSVLSALLPWTDLLLCDLKVFDSERHKALTGVPSDGILENIRRADAAGCKLWIRRPVVPGATDSPKDLEATAAFAATLRNLERFELLPLNTFAGLKYRKVGRRFPLAGTPPPSRETMELLNGILRSRGLPCPKTEIKEQHLL